MQSRQITCKMSMYLKFGGVAKRPKATVCKTVIRRFESGRRLFFPSCMVPAGKVKASGFWKSEYVD